MTPLDSKGSKYFRATIALLFFLFIVSSVSFFVVRNLTPKTVFSYIVRKNNLPIEIERAEWTITFGDIFKNIARFFTKKESFDQSISGIRIKFKVTNPRFTDSGELYSPVYFKKHKEHWFFELHPEIRLNKLPSFKGKLGVDLDLVRNIQNGLRILGKFDSIDSKKLPKEIVDDLVVGTWSIFFKLEQLEKWNLETKVLAQKIIYRKNTIESVQLHSQSAWQKSIQEDSKNKFDLMASSLQIFEGNLFYVEPELKLSSRFSLVREKVVFEKINIEKPIPFQIDGTALFEKGSLKASGHFKAETTLMEILDKRVGQYFGSIVPLLANSSGDGRIQLSGRFEFESEKQFQVDGDLFIKAKKITVPAKSLFLNGLNLKLPLQWPISEKWGRLTVDDITLRSIHLRKIGFDVFADSENISITTENAKGKDEPIKQSLWGGVLEVSRLYLNYPFQDIPEFTAKIKGGPFEFSALQKDFCIVPEKPIAGSFILSYPKIVQKNKSLWLVGDTSANLFGGNAYIGDISVDLSKEYLETGFSLEWNDLDLSAIATWTNFGDMRGGISGFSKNMTVQITPYGPVPLGYDFLIKGNNRAGKNIRFYGRAVNTILELLGNQRENIPWFGKILLDISTTWRNWMPVTAHYMGFHAKTDGKWTELRTLDEDNIEHTELKNITVDPKKHYFLFGSAFTIPLNAHGVYPVLMKTDAFHGWLSGMIEYFKLRMKNQEENSQEKTADASDLKNQCIPVW